MGGGNKSRHHPVKLDTPRRLPPIRKDVTMMRLFALLLGLTGLFGTTATLAQSAPRTAVFAGGCFWCMEGPFEKLAGVSEVVSGYAGGRTVNPTYEQVTAGGTGHTEVVRVSYDPAKVSYATLLEIYWRNVDPFDGGGQFCDRGASYRPEIFVATEDERRIAEQSKTALEQRFGRPIAVRITAATPFYAAEGYHQDYYLRNPLRYKYYRNGCGRDARLDKVWGAEARGDRVAAVRRDARSKQKE
jgi:peptide-methionine (S)-S-oxide reductase